MTDHQWEEWTTFHGDLFRWNDADMKMLDIWRETIVAHGMTLDELTAASRHIAEHDAKKFRTEHLQAIIHHVAARRLAKHRAECEQRDRDAGD